jgi:uncharacterized protein YecE (DUF72 family)
MGPLFDETPEFDREALARALARLAAEGIYLGTSSWKYEGWLGQIYSRERYLNRGRFSRRAFEAECLSEYALTFLAVCGDFSFYQFPAPEFWVRLFGQAPPPFLFAFKVPEQITCKTFPTHPRYGRLGGMENESFLDAGLLDQMFLRPLAPFQERIAALIFEFGAFSKKSMAKPEEFFGRLDDFLKKLPAGFRYGVEVRNPEFLERGYFDVLRARGAAHVYNGWSRMPELPMQLRIPDASTAGFVVARALLRRGRVYEEAVRAFSPYDRIQDPNPEAREALRELVRRARENRQLAFLFVNNRLEGNAPETVRGVVCD